MRLRWTSLVWLLAAATLDAQTFRGGIRGTVTDPTNAALPGVTVTATQVGTGLVRTAVTDAAGTYAFSELPLGDWNVTASLTGFASQTAKGVHVDASAVRRVDFVLEAGGRSESVDVVARSAARRHAPATRRAARSRARRRPSCRSTAATSPSC